MTRAGDTAALDRWVNTIRQGDAVDELAEMPESSVHAVVTDPPYGLAFMGRDWDDFEPKEFQEWCEEWSTEALRVLKPGGHLLAFSGNRTHHRLFSGVEDAGFEVRDTITWHYGSGFPKALDVSKAIDKAADAEREVVGEYQMPDGRDRDWDTHSMDQDVYGEADGADTRRAVEAPSTDAADKWDGWKTALKPATEFVVVARKPFDGTVAENMKEHGTAALNIDACRVGTNPTGGHWPGGDDKIGDENLYSTGRSGGEHNPDGRYPSNVVFDDPAAADLDAQTDDTVSTGGVPDDGQSDDRHEFAANVQASTGGLGDSGGVSRYFYTSKATKAERTLNGQIANGHPTVKPLDLMEWLVRLVTAEGQVVVDPFTGTGTTCKAAKDLGRSFIGVEQQAKWADVARARCGLGPEDPTHVRDESDGQAGLEAFVATDGGEHGGR